MFGNILKNRYKIIQTLGEGGFGKTYLAQDTDMPSARQCVIKQLKPISQDPTIYQIVKERFQREAVILEKLGKDHPQIPALYAYFEEDGYFYLVQEWIDGVTLCKKVEQGGVFSESLVKEILISTLSILDYIHNQGIVHRDIKPDNIICRFSDNQPVMIDFGAVKETLGTIVTNSGNTTPSIVIGTPGFMPSEQSVGRPVYASDLYSLGLTAIYLLTGKFPQELDTDLATGEIIWSNQLKTITPTLATVLQKATQSHPRDRYATVKEMLQALESSAPVSIPTTEVSEIPSVPITKIESQPIPVNQPFRLLPKLMIALPILGALIGTAIFFIRQPQVITKTTEKETPTTPINNTPLSPNSEKKKTPISNKPPFSNSEGQKIPTTTINTSSSPASKPEKTTNKIPQTTVKSPEKQLDDLADRTFYERHPELGGRKIFPSEVALAQEWGKIRQCEAMVDYLFYQRHPELGGRKILPSEIYLGQEWLAIQRNVKGCRG